MPLIPEKIEVLKPDGSHSRYASEHEAHELIRTGAARGLGNKRKFFALRLIVAESGHAESFLAHVKASHVSNIPVIRAHELLAPSPRRHFAFERAVHRNPRMVSPQRIKPADLKSAREYDARLAADEARRTANG